MNNPLEGLAATLGRLPTHKEAWQYMGGGRAAARAAVTALRTQRPDLPRHAKDTTPRSEVPPVTPDPTATQYRMDVQGDTATLEAPKGRICSLDDLLTAANVDRTVWSVERFTVNSYEGFIKDKEGVAERVPLFQVKAILKRDRAALNLHDLKADTLNALNAHAPTYAPIARPRVTGGHILVLSPADAHIGKGAWSAETGEDMDIPTAVDVVRRSVEFLTARALPLGLAEIVLVIGNDFLQTDLPGTTTSGTPVSTAGSYREAFAAARDLAVQLVERLTVHAPVTVMCVPGNHDYQSVLHLSDVLAAWFRNAPDVTVDNRPKPRKYLTRGGVLLGFTHGNEEKHAELPGIMAQERRRDWAEAVCREFITGHFHRKGTKHFFPLTETGGVVVRSVSALSKSDEWHSRKGYLSEPAAECFVYHPKYGLQAQYHWRPSWDDGEK